MSEAREIQVLLSPKTNEILRIGLATKYKKNVEDSFFKNSTTRDGGAFDRIFDEKDDGAQRRQAQDKAAEFLATEAGIEALEKYIQETMQEMQLDHAFVPLHAAVMGLSTSTKAVKEMVELLLQARADPAARNVLGKRPIDVALRPDLSGVVALLRAHEDARSLAIALDAHLPAAAPTRARARM